MKQKVSKIKRIALTTLAAVCALSSVAAISASAETYEKLDKTVNGKHIYALAERYSGYSKISASSYSEPTEIKIFMESQQKTPVEIGYIQMLKLTILPQQVKASA